ncbi:MAG: hypothetical protein L6W00_16620 [Lentisphaeria bacterium]|nr:MAG: hypothetical protein L6W00_16620 [Lentisphaeria bacterium]
MAAVGCRLLRVFPIWKEFQPIERGVGCRNTTSAILMNGRKLPPTRCGRAGVDEEMLRRFRTLCSIAEEYQLELVVGLVTGWMSGCLFVPPALDRLDPISDPCSIQWQVRFVRCFVHELKECRAIRYWELGNESNCMGALPESGSVAWNWTNAIASAIRLEDPTRPVASGMHSLAPGDDCAGCTPWTIEMQGELCDLMTSHPYPHSPSKLAARVDPHNSLRMAFQATVETLTYSDIGRRPGAVEEIGTFCPSYCAERRRRSSSEIRSTTRGRTDPFTFSGGARSTSPDSIFRPTTGARGNGNSDFSPPTSRRSRLPGSCANSASFWTLSRSNHCPNSGVTPSC